MPSEAVLTMNEIERAIILVGVLVILSLLLAGRMLRFQRPAVPPVVSPLAGAHPMEEEVRQVRHRQANTEQQVGDLSARVMRQEAETREVRLQLIAILEGQRRNENLLNTLHNHLLERDR